MDFEIPRLRVKCAQILQRYSDFLKKPQPYLKQLLTDLEHVDKNLYRQCENLINSLNPAQPALDVFVNEVKLFLAENSPHALNPNDEAQLNKPVSVLSGVGGKTSSILSDIGINTVKDIIYFIPRRYEVLSEKIDNGRGVLSGKFLNSSVIWTKQKKQMFLASFKSDNGFFSALWLHFNNTFPASILIKDNLYHLYGAVTTFNGAYAIFHPEFLDDAEIGTVRQIYSIPSKLGQKIYQKAASQALDNYLPYLGETLPDTIRYKFRYPDIYDSFNTLHHPMSQINACKIAERKHPAFLRLIFEELFYLQLRLILRKNKYMQTGGITFDIPKSMLDEIAPMMPFKLTKDQKQALREIFSDMKSPRQMNRLLQGDVGSGKTIVAFISALIAVKNGYQAVIIAPTEILAEQHYTNLNKFLSSSSYNACLLTGSLKSKDKKAIKEAVLSGDIHFIIGTHAVIQDDVSFKNLGFVVIDEQHRFGVKQRKALMDKGFFPDILLMSATPIPRTLALTYYGDLELSEIVSMPPGRIPPVTQVFRESQQSKAFKYVADNLKNGGRAYFVYPVIDESEKTSLKSVVKNAEIVQKFFSDKKVGLLHGRLKADEKNRLLHEFQTGLIDILVSTTVVEVGVDVKDASVILIENADRFGLAQLHQLRGRVGRNDKNSYCYLISSEEVSDTAFKRLKAMEQYSSGFKLAELDLELRGQGDFWGVKQSGIPEFQFADIIKDADILKKARIKAEEIISEDSSLTLPKNSLIRSVLMQRWQDEYELFLVG